FCRLSETTSQCPSLPHDFGGADDGRGNRPDPSALRPSLPDPLDQPAAPRRRPRLRGLPRPGPPSRSSDRHRSQPLAGSDLPHQPPLRVPPPPPRLAPAVGPPMPQRPAAIWLRLPAVLRRQLLEDIAAIVKEVIGEHLREHQPQPSRPPGGRLRPPVEP